MRLLGYVLAGSIFASAVVAACGSDSVNRSDFPPETTDAGPVDAGPLDGLQTIDVSPAEATLTAGDTNQTQAFTATGHFKDGTTRDVTNEVAWKSSVASIVSANGPLAQTVGSRGGEAMISAFSGEATGSAKVHVTLKKTVFGTGVDPSAAARFANAAEDPTLVPVVAYPLDGALVPPNLPAIEFQWKPAATTDLFDIAVNGPNLEIHYFTKCTAIDTGCGGLPDAALWSNITSTLGGQDVSNVVVRAAGTTAGKIGTSTKVGIRFAGEDLRGGLYYFNTKPTPPENKAGIFRYDFESGKVGPFFTSGQCAGCHALSPDGTKMLAPICTDERGCGRPLQMAVVDVATKQVVTPALPIGDSDTQTWSPDNKFYVTTPQCKGGYSPTAPFACVGNSAPGKMMLVDAATNTVVGPIPASDGAIYPSFSTDGKKLVWARAGEIKTSLSVLRSSLYTIDIDTTKSPPVYGTETLLLAASATDNENNYHPSFSPDDKWVLFSRSTCVAAAGDNPAEPDINANHCDTYNDPTARSFVMPAAGGTPIELTIANGIGRNTVSWPKWSPFATKYNAGNVMWITVASNRDYGFRAAHTHDPSGNPNGGVTQLWLVAFDPAKATATQDPSFSPVWLPFQDVTSSNHIGQWATKIVGGVN